MLSGDGGGGWGGGEGWLQMEGDCTLERDVSKGQNRLGSAA